MVLIGVLILVAGGCAVPIIRVARRFEADLRAARAQPTEIPAPRRSPEGDRLAEAPTTLGNRPSRQAASRRRAEADQ